MLRSCTLLLGLILAITPAASAQLCQGEIGVASFSSVDFSLLGTTGAALNYNVGSFGGSGTSQAILWDPSIPNSFIVGGFGFVGRATVAGPGLVDYQLITNGVSTASQMSFDTAGFIIVADAGIDQVVSVNPITGVVTPVTTGPQPWAASVNAGATNPMTGDIYVGGNGSIYVIPLGTTTPVLFVTGWHTSTSFVSGIAFDPFSTDIIATLLTVNRVVRIDSAGTITDLTPPGSVTGPNSVAVDANGDILVGTAGQTVFRIPNAGGAPTLVGTGNATGTSAAGIAPVLTNNLGLKVSPMTAGGATFEVKNVPPGTFEGWTFISYDTALPVNQGPVLGLAPDATTLAILSIVPVAIPGNPLHWTYPAPVGLFPSTPLAVPAGVLPTTIETDFAVLAITPTGFVASPIIRVIF